jgi:hypothetical protein
MTAWTWLERGNRLPTRRRQTFASQSTGSFPRDGERQPFVNQRKSVGSWNGWDLRRSRRLPLKNLREQLVFVPVVAKIN